MIPLPNALNFSLSAAVIAQFFENCSYFVNQLKLLVICLLAPLLIHQWSLVDTAKTSLLTVTSAIFVSISLTAAFDFVAVPDPLTRAGYGGRPSVFQPAH